MALRDGPVLHVDVLDTAHIAAADPKARHRANSYQEHRMGIEAAFSGHSAGTPKAKHRQREKIFTRERARWPRRRSSMGKRHGL